MHAQSRFSSLSSFLTYVSLLIAALAFLSSSQAPFLPRQPIGLLIATLGVAVSLLFSAIETRHHNYWQYYENQAKRIEAIMGINMYPETADFRVKREWFGRGLFGITATQATYGIYMSAMAFFVAMFVMFLL